MLNKLKCAISALILMTLSLNALAAMPGPPASITIVTGDNQTAKVNTTVAGIICVQLKDADNNVIPGYAVSYTVSGGGGVVSIPTENTDNTGTATLPANNWKLGTLSGNNTLTVNAGSGLTVVFNATGTPDAPATITKQSGDAQSGVVNMNVAIVPSVLIKDSFGNAVADGTSVKFMIASGGGTISGASAVTANGVAMVGSWKLGPTPGINTLTASCASLPVVTFSGTTAVGAPGSIIIVTGNSQSATVNTSVSAVLCVEIKDAAGNIVPAGTAVQFTITSGGGSLTGANPSTDANGLATLGGWKLGTTAGTNTLSVTSGTAAPITFTATATPGGPATITTISGDNQTAPVTAILAIPVKVKITDSYSNPVIAGIHVIFAINAGGGQITGGNATTDSTGVATLGSWALGSAVGENGLTITCADAPVVLIHAQAVISTPPAFTSAASALPNPGFVAHPVAFSAASSGMNLTYSWTFGDGTSAAGANVSHAYAVAGTYDVVVSVSDGLNPVISAAISVVINIPAAIVGTGPDSDGDGFSDAFETVAGSTPSNAANTPTGQSIAADALQPLTLTTSAIKLNFVRAGSDTINFTGTLGVPDAFNPMNAVVLVDVGGVAKRVLLNTKGTGTAPGATVKLTLKTIKEIVPKQNAKFSVSLTKGTFAASLAASGLTNATAMKAPVSVIYTVIFNNAVMQKSRAMLYTARAGKTGAAK